MIEGTGRAHGAVTVVNAIPTHEGAAVGIDLWTHASVELDEASGAVQLDVEGEEDVDPSLAEACLDVVADAHGTALSGTVHTRSEIPIARGLKSSSVAANAIVLAALDALDAPADADQVLGLSLAAARQAGVTITGALDDAAASLLGGLVRTDNEKDLVRYREPLNRDHAVLLLVPASKRYTADTGSLDDATPVAERCLSLLDDGAWQEACTLNGLGIAAATGQGLDPAYRALAAGALAAGTTGTGPATAAIVPEDARTLVRRAWEPYTAAGTGILETRTTDERVLPEGSA